jgi:hypothetical protein
MRLWIALLVVFTLAVLPATAIEIVTPEIDDTTVTITDLTLPVPPGSKVGSEPKVIYLNSTEKSASAQKVGRVDMSFFCIVHVFPTDLKSQSTDFSSVQSTAASVDFNLQSPIVEGSILYVVDMWTGDHVMSQPDKGGSLVDNGMTVDGFTGGASSLTISSIDPGAQLWSLHMTLGHAPISTWVTEGSWADEDGESNGILVTDVLRRAGPSHVLAGDVWVLAVVDGTADSGLWVADGDEVRYTVGVVSHAVGASGTTFISDLAISNPFGMRASGWMRFVAEGASWSVSPEATFSIGPGESTSWTDVLQTAFGINDNVKGTLQLGGFPLWSLSVTSRNYAVDDQQRQFGIAIPGLPTWNPITSVEAKVIPGLRENAQFRSNLVVAGAVPAVSSLTIRLFVNGSMVAEDDTYTVPAYGLLMINQVVKKLGVNTVNDGYLEISVDSGAVFAALSVVDGSADDAAYILAESVLD